MLFNYFVKVNGYANRLVPCFFGLYSIMLINKIKGFFMFHVHLQVRELANNVSLQFTALAGSIFFSIFKKLCTKDSALDRIQRMVDTDGW